MDVLRDYNKYSIVKSEQNPKKPISSIKIPYESLITVRRVESPSELYVKVNDMKLDEKVSKYYNPNLIILLVMDLFNFIPSGDVYGNASIL